VEWWTSHDGVSPPVIQAIISDASNGIFFKWRGGHPGYAKKLIGLPEGVYPLTVADYTGETRRTVVYESGGR
jgi:hypothetical protein